jgi:primary-amine oxidase
LGYDSDYIWGEELTADSENAYAMCIFEAPDNKALFQHAQMRYEGLPQTALYVRTVLTVGNYDYTQTFKVRLDGDFEINKELSGYAVGAYHIPNAVKMDLFGAYVSQSSIGALHTHSATYKVDLDVGSGGNGFKVKTLKYGSIADAVPAEFDMTGVKTGSPNSYYYTTDYVNNEGEWDNDGDDVWTPPTSCLRVNSDKKFIVYATDDTTNLGQKRGIMIDIPGSPTQMLPEGDPYLHLQNFTKCDMAVTKLNPADKEAVSMDVFGNLYPRPAADGQDISHFFDNESIEGEDLVIYIHTTKPHYVIAEDLPVPSTMGKPIVFEPYNYFKDGLNPVKYLPGDIKQVEPCIAS